MQETNRGVINNVGGYGPLFLFFLSIFLLYSRTKTKNLLWIYIFASLLNIVLNILLKIIIQQPRPMGEEERKVFELAKNRGKIFPFNTYGMPSGHTQYSFFSLFFIAFKLESPTITLFYSLITLLTMYQRVEFKYHTLFQVIVGAMIGASLGYATYLYSRKCIAGNINKKEDDNSFI
jgi:membrane-associated phospholipid phosphatase